MDGSFPIAYMGCLDQRCSVSPFMKVLPCTLGLDSLSPLRSVKLRYTLTDFDSTYFELALAHGYKMTRRLQVFSPPTTAPLPPHPFHPFPLPVPGTVER